MQLHPLEQLVDVQRHFVVIHAHHEADRYEVRRERIHEAAAERARWQRPAERVNDRVQRALRLPDFFHAEREHLWICGRDPFATHVRLRERATRSFGQDDDSGGDVSGRTITRTRLRIATEARRDCTHAGDAATVHQQRSDRKSRQDIHPHRFGPLAEPTDDLADRGDGIPVIPHRRRRRDPQRTPTGEQIDAFPTNGTAKGKLGSGYVRE